MSLNGLHMHGEAAHMWTHSSLSRRKNTESQATEEKKGAKNKTKNQKNQWYKVVRTRKDNKEKY